LFNIFIDEFIMEMTEEQVCCYAIQIRKLRADKKLGADAATFAFIIFLVESLASLYRKPDASFCHGVVLTPL